MARSKKVRKALELSKQLRRATKTVDDLSKKYTEYVANMSQNERDEFFRARDAKDDNEQEDNDDD